VSMAATPDGGGYWLLAADGGVFSYGDATFYGSEVGMYDTSPAVSIVSTVDGGGYWILQADGTVQPFGDAVDAPIPTLGQGGMPGQSGYGQVTPGVVYNGGAPTSLVNQIQWQSWGGAQATGQGFSDDVRAGGPSSPGEYEPATIVAFNLGLCDGSTVYRSVEWFFPGEGQSFDPTQGLNICNAGLG
jgi:hypothetical protein